MTNHSDWQVTRCNVALFDRLVPLAISLRGYKVTHVDQGVVCGSWVNEKDDVIPPNASLQWRERVVVFWIHGGGYITGSNLGYGTDRCYVMDRFKKHSPFATKPLLFFSVEYPRCPEISVLEIRNVVVANYRWLTEVVGAKNVVIAGDSAGGNMSLLLHQYLTEQQSRDGLSVTLPKALVLVSPWVDLTSTATTDCIEQQNALANSDFIQQPAIDLFRSQLRLTNEEQDRLSPVFFHPSSTFAMPQHGVLVLYGSAEFLKCEIEKWIERVKSTLKKSKNDSKFVVVCAKDMPHDYPNILFDFGWSKSRKLVKEALDRFANVCVEISESAKLGK